MDQAESVLSTPPKNAPVDPTRRRFLSNAAAVAAGGTVLAVAAVPPALAVTAPASPLIDPIFAAIEAHKAVAVAFSDCIAVHSKLEGEIPRDRRQSNIDAHENKIVETDDPRWIESEREVDAIGNAENDAACALVNVRPSTMAGVMALLDYAIAADRDGEKWGVELQDDEGRSRSWHHFLIEMLAYILPNMVKGAVAGVVQS